MHRTWLAIRVFFLILFNRAVAEQVAEIFQRRESVGAAGPAERPAAEPKPAPKPVPAPKPAPKSVRSEAITLLATLQREARLVDFLKEPLDGYSDAQVGAAVRDVHRESAKVIDRFFALRPVLAQEEESPVEVPAGFDAGRFRLVGNVAGEPPFRGRLVHHGWEAATCQLPAWSGTEAAARIVAPVEVELS